MPRRRRQEIDRRKVLVRSGLRRRDNSAAAASPTQWPGRFGLGGRCPSPVPYRSKFGWLLRWRIARLPLSSEGAACPPGQLGPAHADPGCRRREPLRRPGAPAHQDTPSLHGAAPAATRRVHAARHGPQGREPQRSDRAGDEDHEQQEGATHPADPRAEQPSRASAIAPGQPCGSAARQRGDRRRQGREKQENCADEERPARGTRALNGLETPEPPEQRQERSRSGEGAKAADERARDRAPDGADQVAGGERLTRAPPQPAQRG